MGAKLWTKLDENVCGIYIITNIINGKVYVGQSTDIRQRWWHHKYELNKQIHSNRHLQGAWNQYGKENFEFSILELCEENDLDNREIYWISEYNSKNPEFGYNLSDGGGGTRGTILTEEQKEYMSKVKNPEKVVQIDFNGNVVCIWRSATHVQRTYNNIRARSILQCCRHITHQANGYIWFYKDELDKIENFDVEQYMLKYSRFFNIPILQYDLYGRLIKEWDYLDLKNSYKKFSSITRCCRHERNSYDGFIWRYKFEKENDFSQEYLLHSRRSCGKYYIN
jgi:group I intron endonuclease